MPDHTDNIILNKFFSEDQNFERRSWSCLQQTCSRFLILILAQFFVTVLIICGCFWRIHLAKTCDESTVWVGILCSAAGYILLSPKLLTIWFLQKTAFLYLWLDQAIPAKRTLYMSGWKLEHFNPNLTKFVFFNQPHQPLYDVMQKELIILSLFKVYILSLSTLWKAMVPSICYFLMTHVQKVATLRSLWILLPLADIADLVLYT